MAIMDPSGIPADRRHLELDDRSQLLRFELLLGQRRFDEAQEVVEDLWLEATDAHRGLYQGLSNALTAVCARDARQRRGARQIAQRTLAMLAPYPRLALGIDLDVLLESVQDYVIRGDGPILVLRQG
jgi:hypothetical protein